MRREPDDRIPYFTEFGQGDVHPILAALGKFAYKASGAGDIINLLGGNSGIRPEPGWRGAMQEQLSMPGVGGGLGAIRIPQGSKYAPRTKGLYAESLQSGDETMGYTGFEQGFNPGGNPGFRGYNLRNEQGDIIAAADRRRNYSLDPWDPVNKPKPKWGKGAEVPEMWVRPDYRTTPAMFDLYNLLARGGRDELFAAFANPDLKNVFERRMARNRGELDPGRKPRETGKRAQQRPRDTSFDEYTTGSELSDFELDMHAANQVRPGQTRTDINPRPNVNRVRELRPNHPTVVSIVELGEHNPAAAVRKAEAVDRFPEHVLNGLWRREAEFEGRQRVARAETAEQRRRPITTQLGLTAARERRSGR